MAVTTKNSAARSGFIAVCGNPNCGKTTIFNHITGLHQHVGNYSGVTVEKVTGQFFIPENPDNKYTLIDIPGTYSLSSFTPDEYIAASTLFGEIEDLDDPDVIIAVLDSTNLERSFYFLSQVLQIGKPVVIALNMSDLAAKRGLKVNHRRLSHLLGDIPVIPVIGNKGNGIKELRSAAVSMIGKKPNFPMLKFDDETETLINRLKTEFPDKKRSRAHLLRIIFDVNGPAEKRFFQNENDNSQQVLLEGREKIKEKLGALSVGEVKVLTGASSELFNACVERTDEAKRTKSERIDRWVLNPVLGPVILTALMLFVFQSIFSWAEPFMNFIDSVFGSLAGVVGANVPAGPLQSLLTDGIVGGVGSVLIFLPQIIILFIFIAVLEDSGYMPRAAFLVDRMFRWCGLSGKSFIPMLSSFACAIPGIMATRTIEDRKLRLITIMVAPLMTCSARLPVYAIMIAAFIPYKTYMGIFNLQGITLALLYLLGVVVAVVVSFILNKTIYKTEVGTFMMELPSYKVPTFKSVFIRVFNRAKSFVIRAGTVIMAITIIIWALSYYPRSAEIAQQTDSQVAVIDQQIETLNPALESNSAQIEMLETQKTSLINQAAGEQIRNSYFGIIGRTIEPVFEPLGWDWKITMSVLASFPAREVIIAVLGTIYNLGSEVDEESSSLVSKMRNAKWESGDKIGQHVFNVPVALSIMVFFALCCQCGATLVTIKQETSKWRYAVYTFLYMTTLAYISGFTVYQLFSRIL